MTAARWGIISIRFEKMSVIIIYLKPCIDQILREENVM